MSFLGELPHIKNDKIKKISTKLSRDEMSEAIRILVSNLKFTLLNNPEDKSVKGKVILVTSSIKGEGKTVVSVNTSSILSTSGKKAILIGADLRNPQIHKFLNINKNDTLGLSDYLYRDDGLEYQDLIVNYEGLDILLSGTIPPNPTILLSSKKFNDLILSLKTKYDYIIIDTAPTILVSDTYEIAKLCDDDNLCDKI